jgi:formate-dependent nitrite reductase membrane component NrfD
LDVNFGFRMVLVFFAIAALAFHLITLAIELTTTHTTDDAHRTVKMITRGEFAKPFWFGMILAGNVVPLLLLSAFRFIFPEQMWAFVLVGVLILVGLWFAEDIWVKAPQRIPLS